MYQRLFILSLTLGIGAVPVQGAFETLGHASRASAMGHAVTVHGDDASALWYNTAGLARIERSQISVEYARLFPDLDAGPGIGNWSANYARKLAGGRVGLGVAGLGAGFYTETGLLLGFGRTIGKNLNLGVGLRFMRWSADGYSDPQTLISDADRSGSGLGLDVGARMEAFTLNDGQVSVAFSGQSLNEPNVSESRGGSGIPRRITLGLGYADAMYALEADLEFIDGGSRLRVGAEYKLGGRYDLRLRAGGSGMASDGAAGEVDGGLGLRFGKIVLNYAHHYASEITAGGSQRLSLVYQL